MKKPLPNSLRYNDKMMIYEQKRNIRRINWLLFWVIVSRVVISLTLDAVTSFMPSELAEAQTADYLKSIIIGILTIFLPVYIYFKHEMFSFLGNDIKQELNFNKFSVLQGFIICVLAVSGQFIMQILNIPMTLLQEVWGLADRSVAAISFWNVTLGIISVALFPAVLEEFLLRGVVYGAYKRQSTVAAALFSTVMFAILHINIFGALGYIFLGIMLVSVMSRTGSLYAAMLYHFITNLSALTLTFTLGYLNELEDAGGITNTNVFWLFIGAVIVFMIAMFIFRIITPNAEKNRGRNAAALFLQNLFSIPVILCIIIAVVTQYFIIAQRI